MKQYLEILRQVKQQGILTKNRTGTDTLSVFATHFRHDLSEGFPLLTTKKLHWKSILYENLWFLHPNREISSSNKFLVDNNVSIWNQWANPDHSLGDVYGVQFRHYLKSDNTTVDQVRNGLNALKNNPTDRRIVINAWNVDTVNSDGPYFSGACALPPCHMQIVFKVSNDKLNGMVTMRSNDVFLGKPYNIAGYALWIELFAHLTNLKPGELVINAADAHLYTNHIDQAELQLNRECGRLPTIEFSKDLKDIDDLYNLDDTVNPELIKIVNYNPQPSIKAKVSV